MITTNDSYLKRNFFSSAKSPVYNWRCVDLELNLPYFFVEYVQHKKYASLTARKLAGSLADLEDICMAIQKHQKLQLTRVSLFSPNWLSKSGDWELNALSEIKYGNFGPKEPWVQIFVLQDGRQLIDANLDLDVQDALELQCQFSVNTYL
ncbi:hypothetical protein ACO0LF_07635 [Undibacterium sp. Di27W]|uniref:hypothetical protein n=1 Tax=Undibacterium sp. Di27W TaxID=3413036 RepID=UPI003BF079AF